MSSRHSYKIKTRHLNERSRLLKNKNEDNRRSRNCKKLCIYYNEISTKTIKKNLPRHISRANFFNVHRHCVYSGIYLTLLYGRVKNANKQASLPVIQDALNNIK